MRIQRGRFIILVFFLLFGADVEAVTRYIAPSSPGNDSNSCGASTSASTPKQHFEGGSGAIACMASGDTLIMMGGTYTRFIQADAGSIPNGLNSAAPTRFVVRPGDTVTATGAGIGDVSVIQFNNGAAKSYITIDGGTNCGANSNGAACKLIFDGTGSAASALVNIGTTNNNITLTNFELKTTVNNGMGFAADSSTVSNCNIHHNGDNSSPSSAYGIYQGAGSDSVIENCAVHHNGGYGIHANACDVNRGSTDCGGQDHTIHRAKFRYNDIYANGVYSTIECAGLLVGGFSEDVEAYGNVVHDNGGNCGGIQHNYFRQVLRSKIYNNTVTRNARFGIDMATAQDSLVTNNLVGNNNTSNTNRYNIEITSQGSGNTYTTNDCFGTGLTSGGCNLGVTPNFVNAAGGNFQLAVGSPGINAGTTLAAPYNSDMFGTPRPVGAFDLGALEYIGVTTTTPPQLVLALPLDEGGGTIATDVSGQKNNATLVGGASWDNSGRFGKAIALDGTGYLTVAPASSLALAPQMTLEAWIYPTAAFTGFATVIRQDRYFLYAASDSGYCPAIPLAPLGGYSTTVINSICATSVPAINTWTHLAVTHDGLTMNFYLNGILVASQTSTDPMIPTGFPLTIGASQFGENFIGRIDQPMVFNYPRTQAQIISDMNTPLIGGPGKYVEIAAPASVEISASSSIEISAD